MMSTTTDTAQKAEQEHRAAYLKAMRQVPGAVAIIACEHAGIRGGLAATAWTSVCADPPTMLVCVNTSASAHDALTSAEFFSISLLPADDVETPAIFSGRRNLSGNDRFLPEAWNTGAAGQPVLKRAPATFECRRLDCHKYGTHTVLIGQVENTGFQPACPGLLYVDGRYTSAMGFD